MVFLRGMKIAFFMPFYVDSVKHSVDFFRALDVIFIVFLLKRGGYPYII